MLAAISYREPCNRLIFRDCIVSIVPLELASRGVSFVLLSYKRKKNFRSVYARDTRRDSRWERWEKGGETRARKWEGDDDEGEIGFALQSRWSVTMRRFVSASTQALIRSMNYPITLLSETVLDRDARCEIYITGGSLNLISRQFSRETKFLSLRSRSAIKCAGILRIWKYDLIKG